MSQKKPPRCCHPDCFDCPYKDCRWDVMTTGDYTETNNRDYFLHRDSSGMALHKGSDLNYRYQRQIAYQRENRAPKDRHEYNQKYYQEHGEEIKARKRETYDTAQNTRMCRKYRKKHIEARREYEKLYYERNKEKIKKRARERYVQQKEAANA